MSPARHAAPALALLLAASGAAPTWAAPGPEATPPGAAAAERGPAGPRRAARVTLVMPPGEDQASALALLAVARGEPVTPRELRRSVLRLFQQERCRDVVVRERDVPPPPGEGGRWVDLEFHCEPHRRLGELRVVLDGPAPVDAAALRKAAGLEVGAPLDEVDLAAAAERVRASLRRRGHRSAEVAAALSGARTATATLTVRAGAATRVASLRLPGAGALEEGLAGRLPLRAGEVLDEDRLAAAVVALRDALREAGRWRSRVGAPAVVEGPAGAQVELPVEPGPRVTLHFRGAAAFRPEELRALVTVEAGQAFDAPAVEAAAERVRAFYRARGFAAATVEAVERAAGGELAVVFHVHEGRTWRLGPVRFEGVEGQGEAALRARLLAHLEEELTGEAAGGAAERARALRASFPGAPPLREPPPPLPPGAFLDEVALEHAAERLVDGCRADGWLEAALLGWTADLDSARGEVAVTLRLREGIRTTVESIGFEGNAAVPLAELAREARLAPGDPLAYEQVEATRVAILKLYLARSHLYARVEVREQVDPVSHQAQLRFVVDEGPRVRIGRILLTGNARTRDAVVRRSLEVEEGALHDPEAMARSQAALLRLGVFRSVGLRLHEPEVPEPVKDLLVELSERPWQYLAPGAGFSIADGPRAFLEYGRPNLGGQALEFAGRAKVNYPLPWFGREFVTASPKNTIEGRLDMGLHAPRLDVLSTPVTGRLDLLGEVLRRRAYDMARGAVMAGSDYALTSRVSFSLQVELEVDNIRKSGAAGVLTQADLERLRFDQGITTLLSVRPSATLDFRDNAAHPRKGWFASGSVELAHSLGGPGGRFLFFPGSEIFTSLAKLQATASTHLPLGGSTVLAFLARGGRVVPLDSRSRTILPKRFYLGGASTLRGYAEEEMVPEDQRAVLTEEARHCASSLSGAGCTARGADLAAGKSAVSEGGEAFLVLKAELRQSLGGGVEAGLFVDAGNLWLDPRNFRVVELRPTVGLGLRFLTPVGPAVLDLGFNLSPDRMLNERTVAPHFSIGLF